MEAAAAASETELTDVTDRRVAWMPWPSMIGRYGGGAGLRHCEPILAVTARSASPTPPNAARRAEVVAAAQRAVHSHAVAPQVAGCELPRALPDEGEGGSWSWSSAMVVTTRLPSAEDGVHNLFCHPWLFEEYIATSAELPNEEGKSVWPLMGLFDAEGIVSADDADSATWLGHAGELRPADQHCHLVGDPPIELEPGMFFTPEPEWLIGADMGKLALAEDQPCCSALVACVQVSPDGRECRCLLLRLVVLDTGLATAATSAIMAKDTLESPEVGTTTAGKLARLASALREAGALDAAQESNLAGWRGD